MIEHLKRPPALRLFIANGGTSTIWVAGVFITVWRSIFCQPKADFLALLWCEGRVQRLRARVTIWRAKVVISSVNAHM